MDRRAALKMTAGLGFISALPGCGGGSDNDDAQVRLLNLQTDAETLSLKIDGNTKISGVKFEAMSGYTTIGNGSKTTEIVTEPGATVASTSTSTYSAGAKYTAILAGADGVNSALIRIDNEPKADTDYIKVQIINYVARGESYDVYLTAQDASIDSASSSFRSSGAGTGSYVKLDKGTYRVRVCPAGTKQVIFDTAPITIASRQVVSIVLYSVKSGRLVNAYLLHGQDSAESSQLLPNKLARIRFVNGVATDDRVSVKVAGSTVFGGIPTQFATSYFTVDAGTLTVSASLDSARTDLGAQTVTCQPGRDYVIVATGNTAAGYVISSTESANVAPRSGYARVQVINASTDRVNADTFVNYRRDFSSIGGGKVSTPVEYAAETYYFSASFSDQAASVADYGSYELEANKSYSMLLFGDTSKRVMKFSVGL
jgi:Domain of unknown function (DUF4397)